ncbi:unnamed protein product [Brachionus calyciflorus]|uniref:Uncharacterized protein n=1 Tax=Brachionus calyciflorus TaxID=104777 RepID=A0A813XCE5_9BILA|nr:unnamed protein product [Brachionus calyciflorus]
MTDVEYYSTGSIEIPLRDSDEVIELGLDQLPDGEEVLSILIQENCPLHVWIRLAIGYYKQGKLADFVHILEKSQPSANINYRGFEKDKLKALDTLAAHYVQMANKEKNKDLKKDYCNKATLLYTSADKISMYDSDHLLSRAYFCLLDSDKLDQADAQFNFVLSTNQYNVAALVGKATIAFNKKDYKTSLNLYKKALKTNSNAPAGVRLGMGLCFYKLGKIPKAKLAFERALELDQQCVGALIGLSILELNNKTTDSTKLGVEMLSKAYQLDSKNPIVLNHLANHFFYKKDYQKVQQLAMHAFHNTENEFIRAETCYQLARSYHIQGDYDQAFQYYYQATQFNSSSFILPFFGLGQMYLHRNDPENAALCFEKVLKSNPNNYEAMKILGSIYSGSKEPEKKELAKQNFKKVTELCPDDVEAWIEYAQLLESNDIQGALTAYGLATKILKEKVNEEVPPEILNNVGSLHFRLGNYDESKRYFDAALKFVNNEIIHDKVYYSAIQTTIEYNLARLYEAKHEYDIADKSYKHILSKQPQYIDCILRIGCMCRDRGQIHEASEWFKEALRFTQTQPDSWSLLGNLYFDKEQLGPAQNQFERIIKNNEQDTYALVALGNIWLHTLYQPTKDKSKEKRHEQRALQMYKTVLKIDPRNIWAANGVGCVLAHKGLLNEARDIFAQVREATADFSDVWLNIAHILVEQKQFIRAIQMYENCSKKFYKHTNTQLCLYLIRALFRANRLAECKQMLLKARHVAPDDTLFMFNLALVQQKLARQVMSDNKSNLRTVQSAMYDLKSAWRTFNYLLSVGEAEKLREFKVDPKSEAKFCEDLLAQGKYHLTRAEKIDEEERELKRRKEQEIQQIKLKQMNEELLKEQEQEAQRLALEQKRLDFIRQTQNMIIVEEKFEKKSAKKRSKKDTTDIVTSGSESETGEPKPSKSKKSKSKKRRTAEMSGDDDRDNEASQDSQEAKSSKKKKSKSRIKNSILSDDDDSRTQDDSDTEKSSKKKKQKTEKSSKSKSSKQESSQKNSNYKSREYISSSESNNEQEEGEEEEEEERQVSGDESTNNDAKEIQSGDEVNNQDDETMENDEQVEENGEEQEEQEEEQGEENEEEQGEQQEENEEANEEEQEEYQEQEEEGNEEEVQEEAQDEEEEEE